MPASVCELTPILIQFSKKIFYLLEKNSYLVMSGIWQKEQAESVIQEYQKYPVKLIHQDSSDGWYGITFQRPLHNLWNKMRSNIFGMGI